MSDASVILDELVDEAGLRHLIDPAYKLKAEVRAFMQEVRKHMGVTGGTVTVRDPAGWRDGTTSIVAIQWAYEATPSNAGWETASYGTPAWDAVMDVKIALEKVTRVLDAYDANQIGFNLAVNVGDPTWVTEYHTRKKMTPTSFPIGSYPMAVEESSAGRLAVRAMHELQVATATRRAKEVERMIEDFLYQEDYSDVWVNSFDVTPKEASFDLYFTEMNVVSPRDTVFEIANGSLTALSDFLQEEGFNVIDYGELTGKGIRDLGLHVKARIGMVREVQEGGRSLVRRTQQNWILKRVKETAMAYFDGEEEYLVPTCTVEMVKDSKDMVLARVFFNQKAPDEESARAHAAEVEGDVKRALEDEPDFEVRGGYASTPYQDMDDSPFWHCDFMCEVKVGGARVQESYAGRLARDATFRIQGDKIKERIEDWLTNHVHQYGVEVSYGISKNVYDFTIKFEANAVPGQVRAIAMDHLASARWYVQKGGTEVIDYDVVSVHEIVGTGVDQVTATMQVATARYNVQEAGPGKLVRDVMRLVGGDRVKMVAVKKEFEKAGFEKVRITKRHRRVDYGIPLSMFQADLWLGSYEEQSDAGLPRGYRFKLAIKNMLITALPQDANDISSLSVQGEGEGDPDRYTVYWNMPEAPGSNELIIINP